MILAEGCRNRRNRFWQTWSYTDHVVLADPIHLRYFANAHVDPFSLGADFGALLVMRRDGSAILYHDHRVSRSIEEAHVDQRITLPWYDGLTPGRGPRRLVLEQVLREHGGRIHDALNDPLGREVITIISELRRYKDPDEIEQIRHCCRIAEKGFVWARSNAQAGMSELDVYRGIWNVCSDAAERAVIVYGDFAVSPGPQRRGGPPTKLVLSNGDMLILDYSVILGGYRSDFTNTLVIGGTPRPEQQRLYDLCTSAMKAGEAKLRAGVPCQTVYDAVQEVFGKAGMAEHFPHHAGHGLGVCHPEAPYIVRHSAETLLAGDIITLEPGLYVKDVGGIRIEHNYLITPDGFERLSNHTIALT